MGMSVCLNIECTQYVCAVYECMHTVTFWLLLIYIARNLFQNENLCNIQKGETNIYMECNIKMYKAFIYII